MNINDEKKNMTRTRGKGNEEKQTRNINEVYENEEEKMRTRQ